MTQYSIFSRAGRWLLALCVAAGLAACSTVPSGPAATVTSGDSVALAPPMPDVAPAPSFPVAPSASVAAESRSRMAPRPPMPGRLGTQWGEGGSSAVQTVQATRLTPDRPQALAQLRYADAAALRQALGGYGERQQNMLLAQGDVEWAVLGENGMVLPIQHTRGAQDYQVAGRQGDRYTLLFTNRSRRHYEVVATVDGLDVLSGQPGSVRNEGYLLRAGETLRIEGFRKSSSEVATFRFATPDRAYAANTPAGQVRNIGVMGAALFEVQLAGPDAAPPPRPYPGTPAPQPFPGDARPYAPPPQYR